MKKNIQKLGQFLLIPALAIMVGCSNPGGGKQPNPPAPGGDNLSEIQLTPKTFQAGSQFTLTCNVTEKTKVENPKYKWEMIHSIDMFSPYYKEATVENGKISWVGSTNYPGSMLVTLTLTGTYNKAQYKESRTINFIIDNNDIRNCNWGESKESCKTKLNHYKFTDLDESKANELSFNEENVFEKNHWDGSITHKIMHTLIGDRHTTYLFKNNGLTGVSYQLTNWVKADSLAVNEGQIMFRFYSDSEHMKKEETKFDYAVASGIVLTDVEKAQAEKFKNGKADKSCTALYNAVKANKVTLKGTNSCTATKIDMEMVNDANKNQVVLNVTHTPNK